MHDVIEKSFLDSLEMTRFKGFLHDHHYISNQYIFVAQLINLILKWYCSKTKNSTLFQFILKDLKTIVANYMLSI